VILEGVAPGEQVVTDGQVNLIPGAKVAIKGASPGANPAEADTTHAEQPRAEGKPP
jgi:hypothetical protein